MLQDIRDNAQGVIAKIIIGLIVVIFAAAGVESLLGGSADTHVAEINGEELAASELEQAVYLQKRRILESMGENADPSLLDDTLMRNSSLEQLIRRKLLLQAAEREGLAVSVAAVDQLILGMPQFQQDGQFSPQLYQNVLRSNGYTMAYFKQLLSSDLLSQQLSAGVAGSDFVTPGELAQTAALISQQRSFQYLTLSSAAIAAELSVDEQAVESYYQKNLTRFQRPEKVKLSYIELRQSDLLNEVDEQAVRDAYQLELAEFQASEERRSSHILLEFSDQRDQDATKTLALELVASIEAGADFASVAAEKSDDLGSARQGGDLGFTTGDTFPVEFEEALFALELNGVSVPVETDAGYHIIKATEIRGVEAPSFEQRRAAITQRLQYADAEADFVVLVEQLKDQVFNAEDLVGPAAELALSVSESEWLSRGAGDGLFSHAALAAAAFSDEVLLEANNSEVVELAADHFVVLRVREHQPAEAMPLSEVKSAIVATLTRERATARAIAEAQGLVERLASGTESVEVLAVENSYPWKAHELVTRSAADVDREIISAVFALSKPATDSVTVDSATLSTGDVVILRLDAVNEGSLSDLAEQEQQAISAQLLQSQRMQSQNAFERSLRELADITVL